MHTIGKKFLQQHHFCKVGYIKVESRIKITFEVSSDIASAGVYMWLTNRGNKYDVQYVGKAGKGPKARMRQHKQGINSGSQKRRKSIIKAFCKKDERLEIWFRTSKMGKVAGLYKLPISFYSIEEEALIKRFEPPLNRGHKKLDVS